MNLIQHKQKKAPQIPWHIHIKSFVYPQVIETIPSEINNTITVDVYHGKLRTLVNNIPQSSVSERKLLQHAFDRGDMQCSKLKNVLLLGLGVGSMVEEIRRRNKNCTIVGVDIDPQMIEIGKKYFDLKTYSNLNIIVSDAYSLLEKRSLNQTFDLIISSLYIGGDTPKQLQSTQFVTTVHDHLTTDGVYIANYSNLPNYKKQSHQYFVKVKKVFHKSKKILFNQNMLIIGYKRNK